MDPKTCQHEVVMIRRKLRDGLAKRYNGRAEYVGCLVDIPVYVEFEVRSIGEQEYDTQVTEWDVDQIQLSRENKK